MTTTITSLDALLAEASIKQLLATYVHHLDDGKFSEIADLMAHSTFRVMADIATGREEVEAFLIRGVQRHADGTPRTWHSLSNVLVHIGPAGDRASSVCYFTVHQELQGFPLQPICTGRYEDTFERANGAWRFSSRVVVPRHFGDLSRHVGAQPAPSKVG